MLNLFLSTSQEASRWLFFGPTGKPTARFVFVRDTSRNPTTCSCCRFGLNKNTPKTRHFRSGVLINTNGPCHTVRWVNCLSSHRSTSGRPNICRSTRLCSDQLGRRMVVHPEPSLLTNPHLGTTHTLSYQPPVWLSLRSALNVCAFMQDGSTPAAFVRDVKYIARRSDFCRTGHVHSGPWRNATSQTPSRSCSRPRWPAKWTCSRCDFQTRISIALTDTTVSEHHPAPSCLLFTIAPGCLVSLQVIL